MGLSFKMETDDLRESPNVALAETLVGKGFDVRIFDPIVNPARLVGANRDYGAAEAAPPAAPARRIAPTTHSRRRGRGRLVVGTRGRRGAHREPAAASILDLDGRLGCAVEALPGYSGVGW